ncbi:MAG: hypothetical protein IT359_12645 [Gemmatimonadaceae bacterium]|nr:hypothetical protein [Gemmatimonadaceae bacterium]
MHLFGSDDVELALSRVGELLAAEGVTFAVVVVGGAALNLLGIVTRTTTDVDILAFARHRQGAHPDVHSLSEPPTPLPEPLLRAAQNVARDMGLDADWLNSGPALQWRAGLPPGLDARIEWQRYGGLWVGIVARYDLVFFKLFAAADSEGASSVHYQDLLALAPTPAELADAAVWVSTQDAAPEFAQILREVVAQVTRDLDYA